MSSRNISVTMALVISNIIVFILGNFASEPAIFGIPYSAPPAHDTPLTVLRGAYSWYTCFIEGELWRLFSYQFLHANTMHLIFNMWALYFFGPAVEQAMGSRRFLFFYLSCGIAGALFSSLLASLGLFGTEISPIVMELVQDVTGLEHIEFWQVVPMVGASAAIYGVLVAVAFLYPYVRISLIFPPITLTLRNFALLVLAIAVLTVLLNADNAGGEAGHLGGIVLSAIIMQIWRIRYLRNRKN